MFQSDKILKSKLSEIEPEQAEFQTKKNKRLSKKIAPFAIVYFGKKYYLTVAKNKHYSNG